MNGNTGCIFRNCREIVTGIFSKLDAIELFLSTFFIAFHRFFLNAEMSFFFFLNKAVLFVTPMKLYVISKAYSILRNLIFSKGLISWGQRGRTSVELLRTWFH